jgi:hypothetical protein
MPGDNRTVASFDKVAGSATCPAGSQPTGGGYTLTGPAFVIIDKRVDNSWQVGVLNTGSQTISFEVFAECASLVP